MWLGYESLVLIQLNKMAWLKGNIDIAQKWDSLCFFNFMLHGYSSMKLFYCGLHYQLLTHISFKQFIPA